MKRRDPLWSSMLVALALVAGGFAAVVLGERIVARTLRVYEQVPAVVSGGLVGLALVGTGCVFAIVQLGRANAARSSEDTDAVLRELELLAQSMREQRGVRSRPSRKRAS